ncbi:MAG TPA: peptidoglycan editing factor PgeF [Pseudomonadales bacterium]
MTVEWVTPPAGVWPAGSRVLTTTRRMPDAARPGGLDGWNLAAHVGDDPDAVARNRRALMEAAGVSRVQWLTQVHGTRVVEASAASVLEAPEADAAWTRERRLAVAVLTADCVPIALCDRAASVAAVAHGGWRGLVDGVLAALVAAAPVAPGELIAWLGPAIGPAVYEVGEEVTARVAALPDGDRLAATVLRPAGRPGKALLDLFELSARLLERLGVGAVYSDRLCTYSDRRFYSYRRDGRTGRMATLVWLE